MPRVTAKAQFYMLLMFLFQKPNPCLFLEMEKKTVVERTEEMAQSKGLTSEEQGPQFEAPAPIQNARHSSEHVQPQPERDRWVVGLLTSQPGKKGTFQIQGENLP